MATWFRQTQVDLLVTAFAGEAWRARATEIVDQIGTIRAQQAWILCTIVYIDVAQFTGPARYAIAFETTLLQSQARCSVRTGVAVCRARINCNVAIVASVAAAAQTRIISMARLVLAHGAGWTRILQTVALLLLAVLARVAGGTLATIALRQIGTATAIVARLRCTFVDVDFTTTSRKTGRTETEKIGEIEID